MKILKYDFLVIGSGLAGLAFSLKVARLGKTVAVVTKDDITSTNTSWAQGGIAAVMSDDDSFESHIHDTLRAGAGLCNKDVVENYIQQAPARVQELIEWGVHFDIQPTTNKIDLTKEGGHSFRRILHFEDHTGAEIHRALVEITKAQSGITFFNNHFAIDLLMSHKVVKKEHEHYCFGAYVLDKNKSEIIAFTANETVLSTGGAGKVYLYTSNWSGATGDGIAMAYRAGAQIANLEFMQFHPTCLYHENSRNFLITEALRGEGAELINKQGEAFMKKYHSMGSLAPRDIVARSIDAEMKKTGADCVYLDITHKPKDYLETRFPVIYKRCLQFGIDMSKHPIPVVPAAHYLCGGVQTDLNGKTNLHGLWALGETAHTGLHGANRLASNSLLECLAMAHNAFESIQKKQYHRENPEPQPWIYPDFSNDDELIVIHHMWDEIRRLMWNYVGIVRSNKRLERAAHRLENILSEVKEYYSNFKINSDILELRNIAIVAGLTVKCALARKESRGIHYNLDYAWANTEEKPTDPEAKDTVITK